MRPEPLIVVDYGLPARLAGDFIHYSDYFLRFSYPKRQSIIMRLEAGYPKVTGMANMRELLVMGRVMFLRRYLFIPPVSPKICMN